MATALTRVTLVTEASNNTMSFPLDGPRLGATCESRRAFPLWWSLLTIAQSILGCTFFLCTRKIFLNSEWTQGQHALACLQN